MSMDPSRWVNTIPYNSFFYPEEFKKNFESYFKLEEIRL